MATADFPATITDKLFDAVPRKSTTLSSDITNSVTTIPVGSTAGFPSEGYVVIENETIYYTGTTATTFTGCTRGFAGTAVAHLATVAVRYAVVAQWANQVNAEIKAIEGEVGISGSTSTASLNYKILNLGAITQAGSTMAAGLNAQYLGGKTTIDEDDMSSDLATALPTQQSVKAYVDANAGIPTYGKNLIQHSAFWDINDDDLPPMWELHSTPTLVIADDTLFPSRGGKQITITGSGGVEGIQISGGASNWLKVLPETTYTFSIDNKITSGTGNVQLRSYNGASFSTSVGAITINSGTATRSSLTFTTDASIDNLDIEVEATDGSTIICSHPKLEQGAIATPYILNEAEEQANIIQYYKPYARAYLSAPQSNLTNNTWTKVLLNAESFDLGSNFASNKFVTPVTGVYSIQGIVMLDSVGLVADTHYDASIYVNSAGVAVNYTHASASTYLSVPVFYKNKIANAMDIELYIRSLSGNNLVDIFGSPLGTYLEVELITLDI